MATSPTGSWPARHAVAKMALISLVGDVVGHGVRQPSSCFDAGVSLSDIDHLRRGPDATERVRPGDRTGSEPGRTLRGGFSTGRRTPPSWAAGASRCECAARRSLLPEFAVRPDLDNATRVVQRSRLITSVTKLRLVVAIAPVTSQQPGVGK